MGKKQAENSTRNAATLWLLVWGLGIAGQICWNIENQWFNTFVYAKIGKDPSIITGMLFCSAAATTFSTFFFGTWIDRTGKRRLFIGLGYILWGKIYAECRVGGAGGYRDELLRLHGQ